MDGYNGSRKAKAAQLAHWDPKNSQRPYLVPNSTTQIPLCKKEISHHIKMSANAWSSKYR
jgi:hypothetical protein